MTGLIVISSLIVVGQLDVFGDQEAEIRSIIAANKDYLARLEPELKAYEALQEKANNGVVNARAEKPIVIQPKGFPVLYKTEEIKRKDIEARQEKIDKLKRLKTMVLSGSSYAAPELFKYEKTKIGGLGIARNRKLILVRELEKGLGESTFRAVAQMDYTNRNGRESVMFVIYQGYFKFNKPGQVLPCDDILEYMGKTEVEIVKKDPKDGMEKVEKIAIPEVVAAFNAMDKINEALTGEKRLRPMGWDEPNMNTPIDGFPEKKPNEKNEPKKK